MSNRFTSRLLRPRARRAPGQNRSKSFLALCPTLGVLLAISCIFPLPSALFADAGVLIPSIRTQPDPSILSLAEMAIEVKIDDRDARVRIRQIYASHYNGVLEGNYVLALPLGTQVSDFAVWDGETRIPGVILERKRAGELYADLKSEAIDPGLLQQGEYTAREAQRSTPFAARVVPIEPYGTKRIEIEYHQDIPVESLQSQFVIPLRPEAYQAQEVGRLWISFELHSAFPLRHFEQLSRSYPLKITRQDSHTIEGSFDGQDLALTDDFAVRYALDGSHGIRLKVVTHRSPNPAAPSPAETSSQPGSSPQGFFEASLLLQPPGTPVASDTSATASLHSVPALNGAPRTLVLLFDESLSMQWDKLDRSYQALETLLRVLRPEDKFNVLLFNTAIRPFAPAPVPAEPTRIDQALRFVRGSDIRGAAERRWASAAIAPRTTLPTLAGVDLPARRLAVAQKHQVVLARTLHLGERRIEGAFKVRAFKTCSFLKARRKTLTWFIH
jgi:Ca-activated chloride channel homolog